MKKTHLKTGLLWLFVVCGMQLYTQELVVRLETESAQLFGDLKAKPINGSMLPGLSGGRYTGDFHYSANSHMRFSAIDIPEEGTYELKVFSMGSGRPMAVKVNQYVKTIVRTNDSPNWDSAPTAEMSVLIYFDKGLNVMDLSTHNEDGPNLDKLEIYKTNQTIAKPAIEKQAFRYDFTDEAELTAEHPNATFEYLTDNDEYTVYAPGEVQTTSITARTEYPVLLTGYLISGGVQSNQNISNWKMYKSTDGDEWEVLTPTKVTDVGGALLCEIKRIPSQVVTQAARYYRLEASGTELALAEWQLFGIPGLTTADGTNFPADLTQGVNIQANSSALPVGASGANWSERFHNVFDRKISSKYYCHQARQFYIELKMDRPVTLRSYTLTSCADFPDRDPRKWTLNAYNEEEGWIEVDRQQDFTFPCRYATMKFNVNSELPFTRFLLDVETNNGSGDIQLLKWQLFGEDATTSLPGTNGQDLFQVLGGRELLTIIQQGNAELGYTLYNTAGMKVHQGIVDSQYHSIPLVKGVYLVSVTAGTGIHHQKVIVK